MIHYVNDSFVSKVKIMRYSDIGRKTTTTPHFSGETYSCPKLMEKNKLLIRRTIDDERERVTHQLGGNASDFAKRDTY